MADTDRKRPVPPRPAQGPTVNPNAGRAVGIPTAGQRPTARPSWVDDAQRPNNPNFVGERSTAARLAAPPSTAMVPSGPLQGPPNPNAIPVDRAGVATPPTQPGRGMVPAGPRMSGATDLVRQVGQPGQQMVPVRGQGGPGTAMVPSGPRVETTGRFTPEQIRAAQAQTNARMAPLPGAAPGAMPPAGGVPPAGGGGVPPGGAPPQGPAPGPASRGQAASSAARLAQPPRNLIRGGVALGAVGEGLNVMGAVQQAEDGQGLQAGAAEAGRATGRLAAGYGGAKAGAAIGAAGGPWGAGAGAVIGGAGGYALGDEFVQGLENNNTASPDQLAQQRALQGAERATPRETRTMGSGTSNSLLAGVPLPTGRVTQPDGSTRARDAADDMILNPTPEMFLPRAPEAPAAGPSVQGPTAADAGGAIEDGGNPDQVIGQFNGRDITAGESARMAGPNRAGSSPAQQLAAPRRRGAPAANRASTSGARRLEREIDKTIKGLGELNMRSKRQLVGDLLGLKGRLTGQTMDMQAGVGIENARIAAGMQGQELDAQTRLATQGKTRGAQDYVQGEDGNLYFVNEGQLTPVTSSEGSAFRPAQAGKTGPTAAEASLLANLLPPGATPEQFNQSVQQVQTAFGGGGPQYAGQSPAGKPLYRDAQGNLFEGE